MAKKQMTDAEAAAAYRKEQAKRYEYAVKRRIWQELMVKKAKAQGIEVSDEEVLAELKTRDTKLNK